MSCNLQISNRQEYFTGQVDIEKYTLKKLNKRTFYHSATKTAAFDTKIYIPRLHIKDNIVNFMQAILCLIIESQLLQSNYWEPVKTYISSKQHKSRLLCLQPMLTHIFFKQLNDLFCY